MTKLLVITSRNVHSSTGDATLILKRSEAIFKVCNIESYILSLNAHLSNVDSGFKGVKFIVSESSNPLTLINEALTRIKPEVILLSGDKSYLYRPFIVWRLRKFGINPKLFMDLHGAIEEGIEYIQKGEWLKTYIRHYLKKLLFKTQATGVTGLFTVTDALFEHHLNLLPSNSKKNLKKIKVRCGVDEVLSSEMKFRYRNAIRAEWGLNDNTLVFVYSGHKMVWQNFDRILEMFKGIDNTFSDTFFVLLTSSDKEFEEKVKMMFPRRNFYLNFVNRSDLEKYLSGCDLGFLIRDNSITNRVAFPNKFSEYLNSGVMPAISEYLCEPISLLERYELPYIKLTSNNPYEISDFNILSLRQNDLSSYYKRCEIICSHELAYEQQIMNNFTI